MGSFFKTRFVLPLLPLTTILGAARPQSGALPTVQRSAHIYTMSKLNTRKRELETQRNAWREHAAAHPNDPRSADALRQIESELATVNAQRVFGPGARDMINQAIGKAATAHRAPRMPNARPRADVPTPNPLPDPQRTPQPLPFVSPTDVPYPAPDRSAQSDRARQNGRPQAVAPTMPQPTGGQPQAQPQPQAAKTGEQPQPPTAAPPRQYPFTDPTDVPYPSKQP